jgi:hypothetical protein
MSDTKDIKATEEPAPGSALDLLTEKPSLKEEKFDKKSLDPGLILRFAKQIMLGCAIVGMFFALLALIGPPALLNSGASLPDEIEKYVLSTGTSLMSVVTTVIPPIVALVLGFYFGRKDSDR